MRIVLVTPEYPPMPGIGGIGTNTAALARGLSERGHEVRVVVPGDDGAAPAGVSPVPVIPLRRQWIPGARAEQLLADLRTAAAVRKVEPDVVHAAEWGAAALGPARWGGAPVVTRLATPTYLVEQLNGVAAGSGSGLVRVREEEQAHRSAIVYGPTRAIAERVGRDWQLPKVEVVPNPVDLAAVRTAARSHPSRPLPSRFLAFIGRLERRKGIGTLGAALRGLLKRRPDLEVLLIGRDTSQHGGAVMQEFWAAAGPHASRIHLTGELPRAQALAVLARAEAVVLPSLWESFGYVCVEAMALGRPVFASAVGGFEEIVEHGRTGWLLPPDDPAAWEEELDRRLGEPATLAQVGAAARTRAEDFDVDAVTDRVLELLVRASSAAVPDFRPSLYRGGYRQYFRPESASDPFARLYEQKRQAVLTALAAAPRARLLDVGGGYGRFTEPLSAHHDVVLCDLSDEMLAEAATRLGGRVPLVQADAMELPFAEGAFDEVIAMDLLVHLPDLRAGLASLIRMVRPGGRLTFDTTNARPGWVLAFPSYVDWGPKRLLLTLRAGGVLPEWRTLVRHQTPTQVERAIDDLGLHLEDRQPFGPGPLAKWHLWQVRRP